MLRCFFAVFSTMMVLAPVVAQPPVAPKDSKVLIPLMLSPAKEPKPQGKYNLYPGYRDAEPGEKVLGLLKSFMEQTTFFSKEHEEKRQKWLAMPLQDLPADVREQASIKAGIAYDPPYATFLVFIDQGARYTRTEWNEWFNLRRDGIHMLLPEVQKIRALAAVIQLRMRGEIKNGEFMRAIESAKTLFGIAQGLEEHPTLIGNLVGLAIATIALNGIEEMIQQPSCPNLYWSLSHLPTPLINIHKGLEGERVFLTTGPLFALARADRVLTSAEIEKALKYMDDLLKLLREKNDPARSAKDIFTKMAANEMGVKNARERLVQYGDFSKETVKEMSAIQVRIADDVLQFTIFRDEAIKWSNLPHPDAMPGLERFEQQLKQLKNDGQSVHLATMLVPSVSNVKSAETRTSQRVAYLRIIEAIRLYSAANDGKLPATLGDLTVPVPLDPVSGKAFLYSLKDGTITLTGANSKPGQPLSNRVYAIQFRK